MVKVGDTIEIKEIELLGGKTTLDIVSSHAYGLSIISLSADDAVKLKGHIEEWLHEQSEISKSARSVS